MTNKEIENQIKLISQVAQCEEINESEYLLPKWELTTEERYDEMLCVLPPEIMIKGGFLVGEPADHRLCKMTNCFKPVFDGFKKVGSGKGEEEFYFVTSEPVTIAEFKILMERNI